MAVFGEHSAELHTNVHIKCFCELIKKASLHFVKLTPEFLHTNVALYIPVSHLIMPHLVITYQN